MNLLVAILCPITVITNLSKDPWNKHDSRVMKTSQKRCRVYYKDAPCLKKFIKKGVRNYYAICGN